MSSESLTLRSPWLQWLLAEVFPRLRAWPLSEWPRVLAAARATPYQMLEMIGTLGSVVISASLVQPMLTADAAALTDYLGQYLLAVPVFAVTFVPFYTRRIRRGIEIAYRNERPDGMPPQA